MTKLTPCDVLAVHPQGSWYGIPWARWYLTGGAQGEEPTDAIKKQLALYDAFKSDADQEKAQKIFAEILQIAADEFEIMGISLAPHLVGVVKNGLNSVPASIPASWMYPDPGPTLPQTYYWAK